MTVVVLRLLPALLIVSLPAPGGRLVTGCGTLLLELGEGGVWVLVSTCAWTGRAAKTAAVSANAAKVILNIL